MQAYRDLKFTSELRTNETVTQIVMVLQETYLLNAVLCHNISVTIRIIQYWGTAREPKDASH